VGSGLAPGCGSVLGVVKCGRLFMASQFRVGRGIHSSGSLPTRPASPARFRHARPRARCREVRSGRVLSWLTHLPLLTDQRALATKGPSPSVLADWWVPGTRGHSVDTWRRSAAFYGVTRMWYLGLLGYPFA
jgi:hypothetical protein